MRDSHEPQRQSGEMPPVTVTAPRRAVRMTAATRVARAKLQPTVYLPGRALDRRDAA